MLERELAFAHELADRAAEIALRWFRSADLRVRQKADLTPVTQADAEIEAMARSALAERFPHDAVLGEEEGMAGEAGRMWILDPIDGTKNFADGVQIWATLVALADEGRPVLGVVSFPALGERYDAVRRRGARLNGRPITVSDRSRVTDAFVLFSSVEGWLGGPLSEPFQGLLRDARRTRGFGDAWGHMLVARGAADVMIEKELAIWDWAAPHVIVEEAGGRMTQLDGSPLAHGQTVLTTNGRLHEDVVARMHG